MPMFTWRVVPDEGAPYVVEAGSRDVLAWERDQVGRSAQQLNDDFHVGDAYWLAHRAAKRAGLFDGTRAEFEASVDLESGTAVRRAAASDNPSDEDGPDPTRPAH